MKEQEWAELLRALRDVSDVEQVAAAATKLHKAATLDDLERLKSLLKDHDFVVREAAAWPVSELAGPAALEELLVAYQRGLDEGQDNDGFTAALIELVEANREQSGKILQVLAETGDGPMRANAVWLLGFCIKNNSK